MQKSRKFVKAQACNIRLNKKNSNTKNQSIEKQDGTTEHSSKIKKHVSKNEKLFVTVRLRIRFLIFMS